MKNVIDIMNICENEENENEKIGNKEICEKFLQTNLTIENVCFMYGVSFVYALKDLMKDCEKKILSYVALKPGSSTFTFDRKYLERVLQSIHISHIETMVFRTSLGWLKAPVEHDELTGDDIDTYIGNAKLLGIKWNDYNAIRCNRFNKGNNYNCFLRGEDTSTTFSIDADKALILGYFVCVPVYRKNYNENARLQNCPVKFTITAKNMDTLYSGEANIDSTSASGEAGAKIILNTPILVRPRVSYEIHIDVEEAVVLHGLKLSCQLDTKPNIRVNFKSVRNWYGHEMAMIQELGFMKT